MKKIFAALAITIGVTAQAQTSVPMSLSEAIGTALDKNPTIKVAGMEIERVDWARKEVVGGFLPTLSADGTYTRSIVQQTMAGMKFGADNTVNFGGTLGLPLVVPALWQSLKLNDEQMRQAVEASRKSRLELVNQVQKAYYGVLVAEQSLKVLRASEATIKNTVDDTRTKLENDMASEYDLVTAEVQLSDLQPQIFSAESGIKNARRMLCMLLSMPLEVDLQLTDKLDALALAMAQHAVEQSDVAENADLRALEIQRDVMQRQFKLMRTQRMPTLAAFGTATLVGQDPISNIFEIQAGAPPLKEFKWQHPINVGAKLTIPIFAGFTNVNKERQLKNQIGQLEVNRNYLEESVKVQAANARENISTALSKMEATAKTTTQALKGYQISQVRFNAGMGTILELNSAELALTRSRLSYTQAQFDYLSARADYEKIIGKE